MTTTIARPSATDRRELMARVEWVLSQRSAATDLVLEGYAAVFESQSEDLGFREVLAPGCFRRALNRPDSDPLLLWSHDTAHPLARRSAGNLLLSEDSSGLHFRATLVPTQVARDAALLVGAGVVRGASFAFTVAPDGDEWSHRGGQSHRRVTEVDQLFEISLVAVPAYSDTSVGPAVREARSRLAAVERARPTVIQVSARSPYGPQSPHSWFRDRIADAENAAAAQVAQTRSGRYSDVTMVQARTWGNTGDMTPEAIRSRLQSVEGRDLSPAGGAAAFVPAGGVPGFIADAYANAARDSAPVASLLPRRPLPKDLNVRTPRFDTGAAVAVQASPNGAVTEVDPTTSQASSPVATIAGHVDVAIQLLEQSSNFDVAIAAELGGAWGEELEVAILNGTGASGQTIGLLGVTGIATETYTDATPTQAEATLAALKLRAAVAAALRHSPTIVVMHPRRRTWWHAWLDTAGHQVTPDLLALEVESNGIRTNLGAGTNEDVVIYLDPTELPLLVSEPVIRTIPEVGSGTLTVRVSTHGYAATLANRRPSAIGKLTGTGLTATL